MDRILSYVKDSVKRIPKNKRYIFLIVGGMLLMVIIAMPEFLTYEKNENIDENLPTTDIQMKYIEQTEEKLCDLISSIKGAGKTKVMLTLDSSEENIYASDINAEKSEYVVIKTDIGENGMLLKIINPKIRGVAVVCEGGDISTVKIDIISAVSTALGISSTKISIAKMKEGAIK